MFGSRELPFFSASFLWSSHFLCLVQRKYTITKNLVWIRPDLRIFTKRKELQFKHAFVFFRIAISHEMTQISLIISKNYKLIFRVFFSLDIFNFLDFFLPFDKILSLFLLFTSNFRFLSSYSIFFFLLFDSYRKLQSMSIASFDSFSFPLRFIISSPTKNCTLRRIFDRLQVINNSIFQIFPFEGKISYSHVWFNIFVDFLFRFLGLGFFLVFCEFGILFLSNEKALMVAVTSSRRFIFAVMGLWALVDILGNWFFMYSIIFLVSTGWMKSIYVSLFYCLNSIYLSSYS